MKRVLADLPACLTACKPATAGEPTGRVAQSTAQRNAKNAQRYSAKELSVTLREKTICEKIIII